MSFDRIKLTLYSAQQAHAELARVWQIIKPWLMAGHRLYIEIRAETRTLKQNSLMWSCLTDLSEQVFWDAKRRLTPEGWKEYLTAHLEGQDLVPNMDGTGFVAIGRGKSTKFDASRSPNFMNRVEPSIASMLPLSMLPCHDASRCASGSFAGRVANHHAGSPMSSSRD